MPGYQTSWYVDAKRLRADGSTLVAHTDWYEDEEGEALAQKLCDALHGNYVLATGATDEFDPSKCGGNRVVASRTCLAGQGSA